MNHQRDEREEGEVVDALGGANSPTLLLRHAMTCQLLRFAFALTCPARKESKLKSSFTHLWACSW